MTVTSLAKLAALAVLAVAVSYTPATFAEGNRGDKKEHRDGDRRDGDRRDGDRRDGDRRDGDRRDGDRREGDRRDGERRDGDRREGDRREEHHERIAIARFYNAQSGEHFYTSNQQEAVSNGFKVEASRYFFLRARGEAERGTASFYRCLIRGGKHLYTTSNTCENSGATLPP
jgi:hypothetical protein